MQSKMIGDAIKNNTTDSDKITKLLFRLAMEKKNLWEVVKWLRIIGNECKY